MKLFLIVLTVLIAQVSASLFDVFQGAVLSVQNSFGKLISDVVTDVKDTVDCTILAVEHVLSLSEDATSRYYGKCGNGANNTDSGNSTQHDNSTKPIEILIELPNNEEYLEKMIPMEIDARINETFSKALNGYDPHGKLKTFENELAKESEQLSEVSNLVKRELEKYSNDSFHSDLNGSEKYSLKSILQEIKLLENRELKTNNDSEAHEIHQVIDKVLDTLNVIEATEASANIKLEEMLSDLETKSNGSFTDLRHQFEEWKEEESKHIHDVIHEMGEHELSSKHSEHFHDTQADFQQPLLCNDILPTNVSSRTCNISAESDSNKTILSKQNSNDYGVLTSTRLLLINASNDTVPNSLENLTAESNRDKTIQLIENTTLPVFNDHLTTSAVIFSETIIKATNPDQIFNHTIPKIFANPNVSLFSTAERTTDVTPYNKIVPLDETTSLSDADSQNLVNLDLLKYEALTETTILNEADQVFPNTTESTFASLVPTLITTTSNLQSNNSDVDAFSENNTPERNGKLLNDVEIRTSTSAIKFVDDSHITEPNEIDTISTNVGKLNATQNILNNNELEYDSTTENSFNSRTTPSGIETLETTIFLINDISSNNRVLNKLYNIDVNSNTVNQDDFDRNEVKLEDLSYITTTSSEINSSNNGFITTDQSVAKLLSNVRTHDFVTVSTPFATTDNLLVNVTTQSLLESTAAIKGSEFSALILSQPNLARDFSTHMETMRPEELVTLSESYVGSNLSTNEEKISRNSNNLSSEVKTTTRTKNTTSSLETTLDEHQEQADKLDTSRVILTSTSAAVKSLMLSTNAPDVRISPNPDTAFLRNQLSTYQQSSSTANNFPLNSDLYPTIGKQTLNFGTENTLYNNLPLAALNRNTDDINSVSLNNQMVSENKLHPQDFNPQDKLGADLNNKIFSHTDAALSGKINQSPAPPKLNLDPNVKRIIDIIRKNIMETGMPFKHPEDLLNGISAHPNPPLQNPNVPDQPVNSMNPYNSWRPKNPQIMNYKNPPLLYFSDKPRPLIPLTTQRPMAVQGINYYNKPSLDYDTFFHIPPKNSDAHQRALKEAKQLIADSKRSEKIINSVLKNKNIYGTRSVFNKPGTLN